MNKHRKNCESCQSQDTWKVQFKCQFCPVLPMTEWMNESVNPIRRHRAAKNNTDLRLFLQIICTGTFDAHDIWDLPSCQKILKTRLQYLSSRAQSMASVLGHRYVQWFLQELSSDWLCESLQASYLRTKFPRGPKFDKIYNADKSIWNMKMWIRID